VRRRAPRTLLAAFCAALGAVPAPAEEGSGAAGEGPERSFWRSLVLDHTGHVAVVLGTAALDSGIDEERGPRSSPLFLGSPPSFDQSIRERFRRAPGDTDAHGFIERNVTPLSRGLAAAAILACNGPRWRDDVTDFLGLWEAQRFGTAATGIVKNLVGRERPRLEFAEEDGASPGSVRRLERSESNRESFYSFHASTAFTTLSYADLVLSRRLAARPAARRWSRAGLYALASYMAWARVLQDGHYLSDVVAGALAGTFTGRSFYGFNHPAEGMDRWISWDPRPGTRVVLAPAAAPVGGAALAARVAF
jgi:membrane-associated phospholipid phosphatase